MTGTAKQADPCGAPILIDSDPIRNRYKSFVIIGTSDFSRRKTGFFEGPFPVDRSFGRRAIGNPSQNCGV
jgi:hypothetical protein